MKLCLLLWTSYARFTNRGKSVMTETIIPSRALGAKSPSGDHQEGLRRGGCPMSWYSLNGCSELLCVSEGANLVSIHSQGQQGTHLCWTWVGLSDVLKEGSWMWSVGSAYDFDYRAAQEPNSVEGNKHCVDESYGPGHSFFYMPHKKTRGFICLGLRGHGGGIAFS
uniref:C-type lectin domain-containing protein n=1 Tax=Mola mola TaxID=94237 RepID=A0A3Q3XNY9_MOLML